MPALSSSPMPPAVARVATAIDANDLGGAPLLAALAEVADPRDRRGVRHQITTILAVAACGVLAGCRSFTAIGEWAANEPLPTSVDVLVSGLRRVVASNG